MEQLDDFQCEPTITWTDRRSQFRQLIHAFRETGKESFTFTLKRISKERLAEIMPYCFFMVPEDSPRPKGEHKLDVDMDACDVPRAARKFIVSHKDGTFTLKIPNLTDVQGIRLVLECFALHEVEESLDQENGSETATS